MYCIVFTAGSGQGWYKGGGQIKVGPSGEMSKEIPVLLTLKVGVRSFSGFLSS